MFRILHVIYDEASIFSLSKENINKRSYATSNKQMNQILRNARKSCDYINIEPHSWNSIFHRKQDSGNLGE